MGFSVSAPTYLFHTPSGYIFRLRIPKDLKTIVGKTEFRYSLRSGFLREAKLKAQAIAYYINELFGKVRNNMTVFSKDMINGLVKSYIQQTLKKDEECKVKGKTYLEDNCWVVGGADMGVDEAKCALGITRTWLANNDHSYMECSAKKLLGDIEFDVDSEEYMELLRELLKSYADVLKVRLKRAVGDYSETDSDMIPMLKDVSSDLNPSVDELIGKMSDLMEAKKEESVKVEEVRSVLFSEVCDRYVAEIMRADGWTEKTKSENEAIYALFVRLYGDMPVSQIDRKFISSFKDMLCLLPPNMNKSNLFKDMPIHDIIESEPEKTLSINTVNKYIRRFSSLFNYAVRNGEMVVNPASNMQIKTKKRPDEERPIYKTEDLVKVFGTPEYQQGKHTKPVNYWSPLIALYTGARLNEICQLYLDDVRKDGDVWVFDINTNTKDKRVKSKASNRLVPIHRHLIEIGLLEYVEILKQQGEERLFPELKKERDGYSQSVSKWYSRYKARYEFTPVFHSFRHTFTTKLKHALVNPILLSELDGHAVEGETMGRYGKRFTPEILLKEAVSKLDYSEVWEQIGGIPMFEMSAK